jgi:hypothetical protein
VTQPATYRPLLANTQADIHFNRNLRMDLGGDQRDTALLALDTLACSIWRTVHPRPEKLMLAAALVHGDTFCDRLMYLADAAEFKPTAEVHRKIIAIMEPLGAQIMTGFSHYVSAKLWIRGDIASISAHDQMRLEAVLAEKDGKNA